ncbi:hypothetical protein SVAN01_04263 [Stagonosporopsis vannaccii]|nr:hypothetical protein SVAN01_04263 [Stagonosporopsis vannaccii]
MEQNDITLSNQLNSPLLRLPPELRNRIYIHLFTNHEVAISYLSQKHLHLHYRALISLNTPFPSNPWSTSPFRFTLPLASKQLHQETTPFIPLFYALNTFRADLLGLSLFLRRPNPRLHLLRSLRVEVNGIVGSSSYVSRPFELTMTVQGLLRDLGKLRGLRKVVFLQRRRRLAGYGRETVVGEMRRLLLVGRGEAEREGEAEGWEEVEIGLVIEWPDEAQWGEDV